MEKINNYLKKLTGIALLLLTCLLLSLSSKANGRDSLINVYSLRLAHKLDSLIAVNAKNDAAGNGRLNNYILRVDERMEDINDTTGFLRQPENPNFGGGSMSFLGNEVNPLKMQQYEAKLNEVNAACTTHKAYLVLIGTILVEVDNTLDENQWRTVNEFFDSRGRNVSELETAYRDSLSKRRRFYQEVLKNVRASIRRTDNSPLAIYNIYSYRLCLKPSRQSKIYSYLHADCYGNFDDRSIFEAFVHTNWKKFNWRSKFRSDFVESALGMIERNNDDYRNMAVFFGTALDAKLDGLYNTMLARKASGQEDNQLLALADSDLGGMLQELNEATFSKLTLQQRAKLLKVLTFGNNLNDGYEHALLYTIRTTPASDAAAIFDILKAVNPLRIDGGVTIYGLYRTMEDEDDTYLVGGMQPGNDNNMLSAAMLALRDLHVKLPDASKETMVNDFAANIDKRFFIWDYNFSTNHLLQGLWGVGSMDYDAVFNKDGSITVTRKEIIGYNWFTLEGPTRENPLPGVFAPKFGQPQTFTINDPLSVIVFSNRSDLGIAVPVDKNVAGEDNMVKSLPAMYLAYANNKKLNKANEDRIGVALTALNLAVPYSRLLTILKTGTAMQKVFAFTQLASSAGSGLRLSNYAVPLQNDTVFNKIITCMELGGIINIFNIKAGAGTVKNIATVEGAEEKIGKFIAAVEGDPVAYNKLLQMIKNNGGNFSAEQKAAAELIMSVKNELQFKGENVFGNRFYTKYNITALNNLIVNKPVARAFESTGLYSVQVVDGMQGTFKVASKTGGNLLAEAVDGSGVVSLTENAALTDGLTEAAMIKVKYKKPGSTNVEDGMLLGSKKPDGTSCLIAGYCFVAGTQVATPQGFKTIDVIKEGDEVFTKDMNTGKNISQRVSAVTKKMANKLVRLVIGKDTVMATPEHPFYTENKGWVFAGDIKKGIRLLTMAGTFATITNVGTIDTSATVYNFEVPQTHNYYVGNQRLLAHNTEVCNALVGEMAVKLGTGYAEMEAVINDIASRYKQLSRLPEDVALAKLEQLCSRAIDKQQLRSLFGKAKNSAAFKEQFVSDIVKYGNLLDEFAREGQLLDNYVAIRTGDYSAYTTVTGDVKTLYPGYVAFATNIRAAVPATLAAKLGQDLSKLKTWINARQLKFAGLNGGLAEAEIFAALDKAIGTRSVREAVEDLQQRFSVVIKREGQTNQVATIHPTVTNEMKVTIFEPCYNPELNTNIPAPLSYNKLLPDYKGTAYIHPATQNKIIKIEMKGNRNGDFKAANEAAGFGSTYEIPTFTKADGTVVQYTWHHLDDFEIIDGKAYCTMQLVEKAAHGGSGVSGMAHSGSVAQWRAYFGSGY